MLMRRLGLVVSVLALTTARGAVPARAQAQPDLVLTPSSGPVGTTVTVSNDPADVNGLCVGGFLGSQEVDVDVTGGGDEVVSTDPLFPTGAGNWTASFTVPAQLAPNTEITVAAVCTKTPFFAPSGTFPYAPAIFTVTAAPTSGGGFTPSGGGTATGGTATPQGGGGNALVPIPLAIQPRFTG